MTTKRKRAKTQATVTIKKLSIKEIRKAIEAAGATIDSLGPCKMECKDAVYAIRPS